MNCPKCRGTLQTLKLQTKQGKELELDQCGLCGGLWFDREELGEFLSGTVEVIDSPDLGASRAFELDYKESACPRCKTTLTRTPNPREPRIQGDVCERCGGLWFDAGEADGIKLSDRVNAAFDGWLAKIKPAAK